jgi:uncharacterized delta-60 repeat protein
MFASRWKKWFARTPKTPRSPRRTLRPTLEALEERTLLTAGALDPTFGLNGLVATDFHAAANAVAVEPNGQIVVAGYAQDPTTGLYDFALTRYNANGQLDTSFGNNGEVLTDFSSVLGGNAYATSVVVQSDGRIVAGGYAFDNTSDANSDHYDFALARYNINGTLDNSFGRNGRAVTDFTSVFGSGGDQINALALQPDGKIVAAGQAFDPSNSVTDFAVARFNQDGNPDTTFGPNNNGLVATNISRSLGFGFSQSSANAVVLQSDGKIVVAGYGFDLGKGYNDFALARYTPSGRLDGTFNTNGVVLTNFGNGNPEGADVANGVALSGNQIVAAGYATPDNSSSGSSRFAVARYTTFGQLDTTFAGTGKITTQINNDDFANGVAVQPDGKIVAAGSTYVPTASDFAFAVARYNTDGTLDGNFNPTGTLPGVATTFFFQTPTDDFGNAVALQPDGKIVVAGQATEPNGDYAFGVARFLAATGTVQISAPAPVLEGGTATITLTRSGDTSGTASVTFSTSDGSAHAGADYNAITQTVVFAPGQASATVNVPTLDDNATGDGARTVNLTLSNPSGMVLGSPSTALLTIQEPEALSQVQFALTSDSTPETNGSAKSIVVTRSGDTSRAASVTVSVLGGSATQGRDFQLASPIVQFAPGQAQASVALTMLNDGALDGSETVVLGLTNPSGASLGSQGTFTLTIDETNVPPPPPPAHRPVFTELVPVRMGRRKLLMVEVLYADTGAMKTEFLSPWQQPAFHNIQASAIQGNGAGVPDEVLLMGQRGRRFVSMTVPV